MWLPHLLVEQHADQQRQRVVGEQRVGSRVVGDVQLRRMRSVSQCGVSSRHHAAGAVPAAGVGTGGRRRRWARLGGWTTTSTTTRLASSPTSCGGGSRRRPTGDVSAVAPTSSPDLRRVARRRGLPARHRRAGRLRAGGAADGVNFAYLADVFVIDGHRGNGLGKRLVKLMVDDGPGSGFRWTLFTSDAHRPVSTVRLRGTGSHRPRPARALSSRRSCGPTAVRRRSSATTSVHVRAREAHRPPTPARRSRSAARDNSGPLSAAEP